MLSDLSLAFFPLGPTGPSGGWRAHRHRDNEPGSGLVAASPPSVWVLGRGDAGPFPIFLMPSQMRGSPLRLLCLRSVMCDCG